MGLAAILTGCANSEAVHLQNAAGQMVTCGPYAATFIAESRLTAQEQLRDCVSDFQRQGYERTPHG